MLMARIELLEVEPTIRFNESLYSMLLSQNAMLGNKPRHCATY